MIAITNTTIYTITQGILSHGTILIEDGKIKQVGTNIQIPSDAEVIDATGKIVMPGLIDAHCHTGVFPDGIGWEYSDGNEMTDPVTPHLRALDALHPEDPAFPELLQAGVTTILTGPGSGNIIGGQWICVKTVPKSSVEDMILLEPAGMKMALGENPRRVYGNQHKMPSTRMGNAAILRNALVEAQNYLNKWEQYQRDLAEYEKKVQSGSADAKPPVPPERNLKHEALGKVLRREMKARIHAHRADDMLTAIRIAEEFNLDLTLEHATEGHKIANILAEKKIPVTAGPIFISRMKYELKGKTHKNPGIMSKAGVKVAIQTDEMSAVQYLSISAALAVREGMPEEEALKAITIYPAEIIGVADRVGSIEAGKDADLVIFSGHPFDYKTIVEKVFVDGQLVIQPAKRIKPKSKMNSRARLELSLSHREPDRVPFDLGGSSVTGIHVSAVYQLRQLFHLDPPGTPVKVIEPFMMLGEVKMDLIEALGIDVITLRGQKNSFGFRNEGWKPWTTFDGTPVLVPEKFNTIPEADGSLLMYPQGDPSAPASGIMPAGGYYFDIIVRQKNLEQYPPRVEDNLEEFDEISDAELDYFKREADFLYTQTDKAIFANFGGTAFGDIAKVPAPALKDPKGIRDISEWYISLVTRPDYIYQVFERQCEIGLKNLQKIYEVVGNKVSVVTLTGTDFGSQKGPFVSPKTYRNLFQPFHRRLNEWIHKNTRWKTFMHTCGSVRPLIPEFIKAGFDILNPVQTSAADMDPQTLKKDYGDQITFWGGGIDTQHTLPYGTPAQIRDEVIRNIRTFAPGGGFVFAAIHNIQPNIPPENLKSFLNTFQEFRNYPIKT